MQVSKQSVSNEKKSCNKSHLFYKVYMQLTDVFT